MKRIASFLLFTAMLPACAQQRELFPVTEHQVARALVRHGVGVTEDQISLVARIVARSDDPVLDIDSTQPLTALVDDSRPREKVKLVCHEPRACLPFYAIVIWPPGIVRLAPPRLEPLVRPPTAAIAIRAGSKATLLLDTDQMHISVPVISLQDGSIGARIHVTSLDHHQTWTASIVSSTFLAGRL